MAAGLGLSAILATSALAFSIVKYVGAAYLLYLGISALLSRRASDAGRPCQRLPTSSRVAFGQAVLTGVLNPKVALFFLAFLPQFVDSSRGAVLLQFLLLGLTIAKLDTLYELALVHLTHRLETLRNRISGVVLLLLGLRLALQER